MDTRIRHGLLMALIMGAAPGLAAAQTDSLPPGVTPQLVARGKQVFGGAGLCLACHGLEGKGGIGPDLTDTTWLHIDGSFEALVKQITEGVTVEQSKTGQMMPPKGGSAISAEEIRAVAAYVWTMSRRKR